MKTFIYVDNKQGCYKAFDLSNARWYAPVIFECKAEDISEADEQFQEKMGYDVRKSPNIGCRVIN